MTARTRTTAARPSAAVIAFFLFVFLLPPLNLHACISSGQLLQLGFERLPLLIAPSVDPHLNSARHCDAQVDASCGRKHKQAEK